MEEFIKIFQGLNRAHGVTYVDRKGADGQKIKGKSFVQRDIVTEKMWHNHLNGVEPSLGIIPITDDNTCKWGCIDIDSYAGFDHKKLINKIKNLNLPLLVFRSKSGGAHVFCFTTVPVEAKLMRDKLVSVSAVLGYGGSEVFPKQVELKSKDDTGNFLNLPYFNCKNTTRYCFNDNAEAVSLDGFFNLYQLNKITPDQLENLKIKRPESEFGDGPPCLESITQTEIKDGRDRILYQYIQYAKRKWPESWQGKINAFNYKYFEKHSEGPLDDLQKVELDEPYYWVNVDGERVKLDNIDYLIEQRLFRRTVAKQINKKPKRVTVKEFETYVDQLLQGVEIIKAPEGSSIVDQLKEHLEEFCTNRTAAETTKKDILNGNVYTEEGKHKFIFHKFYHGHLQRKKWPEKPQVTQQMLKEYCSCKDDRIIIGKKRPTIMVVDAFEKPESTHTQRKLKEESPY
jgi:hypothetical protein